MVEGRVAAGGERDRDHVRVAQVAGRRERGPDQTSGRQALGGAGADERQQDDGAALDAFSTRSRSASVSGPATGTVTASAPYRSCTWVGVEAAERAELVVRDRGDVAGQADEAVLARVVRRRHGHGGERDPLRVDQLDGAGSGGRLGHGGGDPQRHQAAGALEAGERGERTV